MDRNDTIYVAERHNCTIRKITPEGIVSTLAGLAGYQGSDDGTGSDARFYEPFGVTVNSEGNIYVADTYNSKIRKITPNGVVSTLAGADAIGCVDGTGSDARFVLPSDVAVDSAGYIYVADTGNNVIRKITPTGIVTSVAGSAAFRGSADGTGSDARFYTPQSVAIDSMGNIYVADYDNNTIRFGRPVSVAPPSLRFSFDFNRLILFWPLAASNYVVETSSTLSPGAVWTPLSTAGGTSGDSFVLTNTVDAAARFYRLRAP